MTARVEITILLVVAAQVLGGSIAEASPASRRVRDFWSWLVHPHRKEIDVALAKVEENLEVARRQHNPFAGTGSRPATLRKLYSETLGILHYAQRLDPENPKILGRLGVVASRLGRARTARRALRKYLVLQPTHGIDPAARVELAQLLADAGRQTEALVQLRLALSGRWSRPAERERAVLALSLLHMERGNLNAAIDLLGHEESRQQQYSYQTSTLLPLALAVAYDRDEQITKAHKVLRQLQQTSSTYPLAVATDSTSSPVVFVSPADQHYFMALMLEIQGALAESRSEWLHYTRSHSPRYRRRARAHITDIDALLRRSRGRRSPRAAQK